MKNMKYKVTRNNANTLFFYDNNIIIAECSTFRKIRYFFNEKTKISIEASDLTYNQIKRNPNIICKYIPEWDNEIVDIFNETIFKIRAQSEYKKIIYKNKYNCESEKTEATKLFKVGETYSTRSIGDHECIFSYTVIKRTEKTITLKDSDSVKTVKIHIYQDTENCYPEGRYSICPVLKA